MVTSILNAVTTQLGMTFGNSHRYYTENVEQGLIKPCFHVKLLLPQQRSKSPVLYDRTMPMVIHWFGDKQKDLNKTCYDMAEQIVECLEYLSFQGTTLRGEDISWQIVDDVLQIFITYKFTTRRVTEEITPMDEMIETVTHSK